MLLPQPLPTGLTTEYFSDLPVAVDVDRIISQLAGSKQIVNLPESEIKYLILKARDIMIKQDVLLDLQAPMKVCGDIHGQFPDLVKIFEYSGYPPNSNYLFLGDYVDRGKQSLEVIILLFAYKIRYPENFFLLRGNHECATINRNYGFFEECTKRYNVRLWKLFNDCFNCMPLCAIIEDKMFCTHGGLSPELRSLEQIRRIVRPTDIPDSGLLCDLVWSDPSPEAPTWRASDRGVSQTFGVQVLNSFLQENDFDLMVRAHQVVQDGYEFFGKGRKCLTVFSAPNYNGEFDNAGAVLDVSEDLTCGFQILRPAILTTTSTTTPFGLAGSFATPTPPISPPIPPYTSPFVSTMSTTPSSSSSSVPPPLGSSLGFYGGGGDNLLNKFAGMGGNSYIGNNNGNFGYPGLGNVVNTYGSGGMNQKLNGSNVNLNNSNNMNININMNMSTEQEDERQQQQQQEQQQQQQTSKGRGGNQRKRK